MMNNLFSCNNVMSLHFSQNALCSYFWKPCLGSPIFRIQTYFSLKRQFACYTPNQSYLQYAFLLSIIDRELFCCPPIFSFLLSSYLRSGILFFLFSSSFSFLPFRSLFRNSGFSIRYSLSLEEILLSFSSGERVRILFMDQGSSQLKVVSQYGLFTVCARF